MVSYVNGSSVEVSVCVGWLAGASHGRSGRARAFNPSYSEESVGETALSKKTSDGKSLEGNNMCLSIQNETSSSYDICRRLSLPSSYSQLPTVRDECVRTSL